MRNEITEKEIEAVTKLAPQRRFEYSIKKIADFGSMWGLCNDGWALAGDDSSEEIFLVWPKYEFALRSATDIWKDFSPKEIPLEIWQGTLLPSLKRDGLKIGVFMDPQGRGIVINCDDFMHYLAEELAKY